MVRYTKPEKFTASVHAETDHANIPVGDATIGAHASRHASGGADELSLDAAQITSGILDVARIPDLDASKITSGVFSWDRLPKHVYAFRDLEITADCDYVDFADLDIITHKAYLICFTYKNPTADSTYIYLWINGDTTGSNYYSQKVGGSGTSVSAARNNAPLIGYCDAGKNESLYGVLFRSPDGYPMYVGQQVHTTGSSTEVHMWAVTKTATVSNITSVRLAAGVTGGIGAGSRAMLFRLGG